MRVHYLLLLVFITGLGFIKPAMAVESQQGIKFTKGTWNEIINIAKKENKPIFIDCYTSWCGPCKMLSKKVFPQKEVGDYFNANFINVKIDCEKGEGPKLKDKFGISAFPTMLFIDAKNERVLHRIVGFVSAEKLLEEAKNAPAEAKRAEKLAADFKKNKKNRKVVEDYLSYLVKISDPKAKEVAHQYFTIVPKTDWHKKEYFWLLARYVKDPFGKEAEYFFKNKDKFIKAQGYKAEGFELDMYYNYAEKIAKVENKADFNQKKFDKLLRLMEANNYKSIESVKDYTNRTLLISTGDYAGYMDIMEKTFARELAKDPDYYRGRGYNLLLHLKNCKDKAVFKRVVKLMEDVIDTQLNNPELDMFGLLCAYRDACDYMQKAGMTGKRLTEVKAIYKLLKNINPKHNKLLDKTYNEAIKDKKEGKNNGRAIPAIKMGGY